MRKCLVVLLTLVPVAGFAQQVRPALLRAVPAAPDKAGPATEKAPSPAKDAPKAYTAVKKSLATISAALDALPHEPNRADALLAIDLQTAQTAGALAGLAPATTALAEPLRELRESVAALRELTTGLHADGLRTAEQVEKIKSSITAIQTALSFESETPPATLPEPVRLACNGLADPGDRPYRLSDLKLLATPITTKDADETTASSKVDTSGLKTTDLTTKAYALTGVCAGLFNWQLADMTDAERDTDAGHRALIETQLTLSRLGKWQRGIFTEVSAERARPRAQLQTAMQSLNDEMRKHGLLRLLSASLFAGTIQGQSGLALEGDSAVAARANTTRITEQVKTFTSAVVSLESLHFGWEGDHSLDASIRGTVGLRPVSTLVSVGGSTTSSLTKSVTSTPAADGATTTVKESVTTTTERAPTFASALQQALVFGVGGRVGIAGKWNTETSLVGMLSAAQLTDDSLLVSSTNTQDVVAAKAGDTRLTQGAAELGLEVRFYDTPLRVAHGEGSMSNPSVSLSAGLRYDTRFQPSGALSGLDLGHPERRLYARAMFDPIKYFYPREVGDKAKTYDFGVGVEYEGPFKTGGSLRIPHSFRFIVRGDLNILSAAGGDSKKKDAGK